MTLTHFSLDIKHDNHKLVLLYRFHVVLILVNLLAVFIDIFAERYSNIIIELCVVGVLFLNLLYLRYKEKLKISAYIFLISVSTALFTQIYLNHFATMSIVFILLLPLTTLLFIEVKESIITAVVMASIMGSLLYSEYLNNPNNPLLQNPQALINLVSAALIIYIFGLLYHFSILRTFDELDASDRQKALLLKEVHHRVKNNLNVIASIIGLQGNSLTGKEKEELLKSKTRIESIAIVHEMLYKHEDFESIDFESYMKRLSSLLLNMYASNKKIIVTIQSDVKSMPLDVMVQLGIMVNELVTNSIKYAFEETGQINMELYYNEENYTFIYSDDGIGHDEPNSLLKSKSLGVKLINLTAKQLKGNLTISSKKGLKYEVRFSS